MKSQKLSLALMAALSPAIAFGARVTLSPGGSYTADDGTTIECKGGSSGDLRPYVCDCYDTSFVETSDKYYFGRVSYNSDGNDIYGDGRTACLQKAQVNSFSAQFIRARNCRRFF